MSSRISSLLIALALACPGAVLHAQEDGDTVPAVVDTENEASVEGSSEAPDASVEQPEASAEPAPDQPAVPAEDPPVEGSVAEPAPGSVLLEEKGDVLEMPVTTGTPAPPISLPTHGMKMHEVERLYGTPLSRDPAIGNPPITRWNYDGFSVFFEHSTVLHAVQKDRPATIYRKDELLPATTP